MKLGVGNVFCFLHPVVVFLFKKIRILRVLVGMFFEQWVVVSKIKEWLWGYKATLIFNPQKILEKLVYSADF